MSKGFVIALLAVLGTAIARPEPQLLYSASPLYGTALSAAYTAPAAPIAPVVPATIPAPAVTLSALPTSSFASVYSYSQGLYQSSFAEPPLVNPSAYVYNSAYRLPSYSSFPYQALPTSAAYIDYLPAYRR